MQKNSDHNMEQKNTQACLIVLDGWGYREENIHNAVAAAKTPNFDKYWNTFPHTLIEASGLAVGLPEGQMGNSEIGHTTIGAGRAIDTDLVRIKKAIVNDEFVTNPAFVKLFNHVREQKSTLHVKGLLGHGGVHAHSDHLIAFLRAANKVGIEKIALHLFTDGRDTAPQSSVKYLEEVESVLAEIGVGKIATISGRFYAMDRDNNWDRLEKAEKAMHEGAGKTLKLSGDIELGGAKSGDAENENILNSPSKYIAKLHAEGILDEHIEPIVFLDENGKSYPIEKNDGIFFFNFRSDRARMLAKNISEKVAEMNWCFVTLTEYQKDLNCSVAFPATSIETTLAKEISIAGLTQAHIAETEKFPHATYFLNGGVETPNDGEKHIMLDSRKDVQTHDMAPKMRAEGIADKAIEEIEAGANFIFINFANPDMVGHTANVPALIEAIEETDLQLGRVVDALRARGEQSSEFGGKKIAVFITADHGNAEVNIDPETGDKHTAHTINPVPVILVSNFEAKLRTSEKPDFEDRGTLADIAPTILDILGVEKPSVMTGVSLIG